MSDLDSRVDFAHQLGHLEGRLVGLERKVEGFEQRVEGKLGIIEGKLDQLHAALYLGRGSWKTLTVLAAVLSALAGLVSWTINQAIFHLGSPP